MRRLHPKKQLKASGLLALLFLLISALPGYSFTGLYAFGDSLSDTGRNPSQPGTYFNGRYSNGALWVKYLSTQLGFAYDPSRNFAFAGSTSSNLAAQVSQLVANTNLDNALFTLWTGGNDFIDNASLAINDPAWSAVINAAVMNITNALGSLYALGAREILVGNIPNIAQIPAAANLPPFYQSYLTTKVGIFNSQLNAGITLVRQRCPGLQIYQLDMYALFGNCYNTPANYGFTVVKNDVLDDTSLTDKSFDGPGRNYLFWDSIHPTTKTHALIAQSAFQLVAVQSTLQKTAGTWNLFLNHLSPAVSYTVQSSPDLSSWSDYQTLKATSTNATVSLTNAVGERLFYRVKY